MMSDDVTFSIIIPTCDRVISRKLERCLSSMSVQTYSNFEVIVVDDGQQEDPTPVVSQFGDRFKLVRKSKTGRIIARNIGMKAAKNDWICWCDDDDAYNLEYLNTFRWHIEQEPEVKLWTCGAVVHSMIIDQDRPKDDDRYLCVDYTDLRRAYTPPLNEEADFPVHANFMSGFIGAGSFVFHRDCFEKTGYFPEWHNHLDIADGIDEWLGYTTGYSGDFKWVGNPNGEDFCFYRKCSMYFRSYKIDACLYTQFRR